MNNLQGIIGPLLSGSSINATAGPKGEEMTQEQILKEIEELGVENGHAAGSLPPTILRKVIPTIKKQITQMDQDIFMLLGGAKGFGKSSVALELHLELDSKFGLNQISFTPHDIMERMMTLPEGQGHHTDEIRLRSTEHMKAESNLVAKVMAESRVFHRFCTWNTPNANAVLSAFRQNAVYYALFVKLGHCVLFKRNTWSEAAGNHPFGFNLRETKKVIDEHTFRKHIIWPAERAGTLVHGKNSAIYFRFPRYTDRMTPEWYMEYRKLRVKATSELIPLGEAPSNGANDRVIDLGPKLLDRNTSIQNVLRGLAEKGIVLPDQEVRQWFTAEVRGGPVVGLGTFRMLRRAAGVEGRTGRPPNPNINKEEKTELGTDIGKVGGE